ncbi:Putative sac domain-containing inositol phosphatase 3 [Heterostelium album PN500]|uniref:Sac domain-containing inositol phosphatase 3 n=1 Tax=Heterostelium pallidum (strain ATCC 26659 / Pp 5 / PN500) TaxID=670386 RepID=D3BB96_HETP5|nr:Putative sac domain-containing inositol phosphatase 3 [Heterostelium album PN500]EFA81303.1 Putative sac domain-containing inositol phosphatase 3 [Heterostelium album PN500]|eukprot:XP_020433421.1 Putative sac domain-containing inositol phosphatase 3 [Heterostelium album PN500]
MDKNNNTFTNNNGNSSVNNTTTTTTSSSSPSSSSTTTDRTNFKQSFWSNLNKNDNQTVNNNIKNVESNYVMPITSFSMQKFVLYETRSRFYLVGSNRTKSRFRLLKIDRTTEEDVVISEDPTEYNKQQLQELLTMIENANREGLSRVCSAYGILGFIRFLHGYYIILITKRRKVGVIGTHLIYGIDDTTYVYVPTSVPRTNSPDFVDETRYKGLFLGLDLTKDFFFSYTYDLTRTLQFNMTRYFHHPAPKTSQIHFNEQFAWNHFLLERLVQQSQTPHWTLPIIHGFFLQEKIDIFGKAVDFILIARRSRHYAGARFLKRGINENGHVANDVETEQIVQEPLSGNTRQAQFTSYVQVRGSIPLYWEQDNNIITPKPPIQMQRMEPFFASTILHFQHLFRRYGSPVVILNLVKSNEKKPRESILLNEFTKCVEQLNEMLPPEHQLLYRAWDFHKAAKAKDEDHMGWLDSFAQQTIQKTGIFHSSKKLYATELSEQCRGATLFRYGDSGTEQVGIARTNCIDSLDRTNTAQFCIGKCALAHQLYVMGYIEEPSIDFNTGVVEVLIEMYEACGNQIALQYGGSELANTIKTYTKNSLSSQSRDLMTTIKRYISNSFIDVDKQHSINLFLGYFVPSRMAENIPLWNLETDHYLHNKTERKQHHLLAYTNWWDEPLKDFKKTSLVANYAEKHSVIQLMKQRAVEFEDNFYKADTYSWIDNHFEYRFNDPIRFRNQISPLANYLESPNLVKKKKNQNGESTSNNQNKDNDENRYDIKRWVFSITKGNRGNKQREDPNTRNGNTDVTSNTKQEDQLKQNEYQPFKEFGIELGTKPIEQDSFASYCQPLEKNINIHQSKYNSQDIYSNTFYSDAEQTKQDLKSFYYHSYLQSHGNKSVYPVVPDNETIYEYHVGSLKNMLMQEQFVNVTKKMHNTTTDGFT